MVRRDLWGYSNEESLSESDLLKIKYQVCIQPIYFNNIPYIYSLCELKVSFQNWVQTFTGWSFWYGIDRIPITSKVLFIFEGLNPLFRSSSFLFILVLNSQLSIFSSGHSTSTRIPNTTGPSRETNDVENHGSGKEHFRWIDRILSHVSGCFCFWSVFCTP